MSISELLQERSRHVECFYGKQRTRFFLENYVENYAEGVHGEIVFLQFQGMVTTRWLWDPHWLLGAGLVFGARSLLKKALKAALCSRTGPFCADPVPGRPGLARGVRKRRIRGWQRVLPTGRIGQAAPSAAAPRSRYPVRKNRALNSISKVRLWKNSFSVLKKNPKKTAANITF